MSVRSKIKKTKETVKRNKTLLINSLLLILGVVAV